MKLTTVVVLVLAFVFAPVMAQVQPCDPEARNAWVVAFHYPKAEQRGYKFVLTPEAFQNPVNVTQGDEEWLGSLAPTLLSGELQGRLLSELTIYRNRCNGDARMDFKLWQEPPKPQKAGSEKRKKTFRMKGQWWNIPW